MSTQGHTPKDFRKKSLQGAITKKTKFSKILEGNEKAAEILFEAGLHCVGCPHYITLVREASNTETKYSIPKREALMLPF